MKENNIFDSLNLKYFTTDEGNIAYFTNDIESDYSLVFLHGLTADHRLFSNNLSPFVDRYKIICWDAPAHGLSRPFGQFDYNKATGYLKNILDVEKAYNPVLVGQSMGGFISQLFMDIYPGVAKGFVAVDTCPFGMGYYSRRDLFRLKNVSHGFRTSPYRLLLALSATYNAKTKERQDNMFNMMSQLSQKEFCDIMENGFGGLPDVLKDIDITCPAVILAGEYDKTGKVKQYSIDWAKRTGLPLFIIPGAAHNSNDDKPKLVNRHISWLLDKIIKEK